MKHLRNLTVFSLGISLGSIFLCPELISASTQEVRAETLDDNTSNGRVTLSIPRAIPKTERETSILWDATPLREALLMLERQSGNSVWIDRRVDPGLPISGSFQNTGALQILRKALDSVPRAAGAHSAPLSVAQPTENILFTAPKSTAFLLRTLLAKKRDELRESLSAADQKKWMAKRTLTWKYLTEPKTILEKISKTLKLEIKDLSKLPYDLWPERAPMNISAFDAALLILVQFDLTLEFTPSAAKIIPLDPDSLLISKTYSASSIPEGLLAEVRKLPGTRTMRKGSKILIRGTLEVHETLAGRSLSGPSQQNDTAERTASRHSATRQSVKQTADSQSPAHAYGLKPGETVSGTVKGPFIPYVKALCSQYGLTLEADEDALRSAGIDPAKHVEVTADKASLEELFSMMAAEASCDAELDGPTLTIRPKR